MKKMMRRARERRSVAGLRFPKWRGVKKEKKKSEAQVVKNE